MKYSIVIVTYNRCDLLKECITCALQQTIAATHIVVIDNACTDDTDRYLNSLSIPQLVHYRLDHNAGGAGGFYEGLKKAHELGDEAHIIIDDDAMLSKESPEKSRDTCICRGCKDRGLYCPGSPSADEKTRLQNGENRTGGISKGVFLLRYGLLLRSDDSR